MARSSASESVWKSLMLGLDVFLLACRDKVFSLCLHLSVGGNVFLLQSLTLISLHFPQRFHDFETCIFMRLAFMYHFLWKEKKEKKNIFVCLLFEKKNWGKTRKKINVYILIVVIVNSHIYIVREIMRKSLIYTKKLRLRFYSRKYIYI